MNIYINMFYIKVYHKALKTAFKQAAVLSVSVGLISLTGQSNLALNEIVQSFTR